MSCLFDSLSYFIDGTPDELRQYIADYLEDGGEIIDGMDTSTVLALDTDHGNGDPASYIRKMRRSSTWGGGVELIAASTIWDLKILVHNIRDRDGEVIEFLPLNAAPVGEIALEWNGSHYTAIREKHKKRRKH